MKPATLERLYGGMTAPDLLREALTDLADELGAEGAQAVVYANGGESVPFCASGRVDPDADREYAEHYSKLDFRILRMLRATAWSVLDESHFVREEERRSSPFHNEFLKRYDCERLLMATAPLARGAKLLFVIGKSVRKREFEKRNRLAMRAYLPHLVASMRARFDLADRTGEGRTADLLLAMAPCAALVVDACGRVVMMNEAARLLAARSNSPMYAGRYLRFRDGGAQSLFEQMCRALRAAPLVATTPGQLGCTFYDHGSAQFVDLQVKRVPTGFNGAASESGDLLLYLMPRTADSRAVVHAMCREFKLTPAERACAERLAVGESIAEIAVALEISTNTIRAHLRTIFQKTGARRQAELIAMLTRQGPR